MGSIKAAIKERMKKLHRFYYMYREVMKRREERKRLWSKAVEQFREEQPKVGSLGDYKDALLRHRVSYEEYMNCYEFWDLDEKMRDTFVSEMEMRCIYRKTVQVRFDRLCSNKVLILNRFGRYVNRKWGFTGSMSLEEFMKFISSTDCIAKPNFGTLGRGVFVIRKDDSHNWQELYAYCRKNNMLIEERLRACKEMEEFHPQSLNTIRVFTISNGSRCELVAAVFRMGVADHVVDNGAAGGILASIDLNTGVVASEGRDEGGHSYLLHPDSGKCIKGFAIPHWDIVVNTCKELAKSMEEIVFAGWDIGVLSNGNVELIEVNSYPSITVLQTAAKMGLKPRLSALGKEVLGYDPVKLISVWSKSYVKYEGVYGRY
ncbi:MAG: hypothetical protein J6T22_06220 [Bacteroidales bacterium]|nr:hypothetical protein [Bacteroidales bacterium]